MRIPTLFAAALAAIMGLPGCVERGSPEGLVDTLEAISGRQEGFRRAHAKGICATGEWRSTGAGARLSASADLARGFTAPVVARFSLASGDPRTSDSASGVRGMALAITLPGAEAHHFVMISSPVFAVRTPADFHDSLQTSVPDPLTGRADPARTAAFNAAHPETAAVLGWVRDHPPSVSYATSPYFAIHTFFLVDAAGKRTPVRWRFEPVAGYQGLTPDQRRTIDPNFLEPELRARLAGGPAEWRVFVSIGQPGDTLVDPTQAWPAERQQIEVARLRITGMPPAGTRGECDPMMFNPLTLPRGMVPSEDPVLRVRGPAYEVSLERRRR